ncbi:MAG TPA: hydantoinase/oxoprolinase family protein [Gaiellaceae bacterium]|nr:hydantoinase/oxoprolinase family protein [Gaiellaceae bacterium]
MGFRISVDTGGTFTDVVVADEAGSLHLAKAPTDVERAFQSIEDGLEQLAPELGLSVAELLARTDVFTYGTTRATNAIVEGRTARTAFFTTEGFPDVLLLREGGKLDPFRQLPYPPPYVPRYLTFEIRERIDSEGEVFEELDEASVVAAIEEARRLRAEAVAVCLIWSIVNPAHERRVGELLARDWPDVPFTLSHQLNPIIREYRRASSTAIDASLKPLMQAYLRALEQDLRAAGLRGHIFVATSFGGAWRPEEVTERPIYSIGSGPSMAPVAALTYSHAETSDRDLIVCDTGGTTFDVGLVSAGEINYSAETWLGGRWIGHITGIRAVDVKSIGAGGGSIVWIDPGGLLRVGPQSAGADPGPACYGHGGTEPTITDAAVVLGWIDPGYFLGGRLPLDAEAAYAAVERAVAAPLGMNVHEAAYAALTIASENIVGAIREITIAQGIDPREVTMVAGGGASGLNIVPIARELGCRRVLLPSMASALSACGALFADIVSEFSRSRYEETRSLDRDAVNEALGHVDARADAFLAGLDGLPVTGTRKDFLVEARYRAQVWELDVPVPRRLESDDDVRAVEEAFHATHERIFAVREPGQYLECLLWKVRATAVLEKPEVRAREAADTGGEAEAHVDAYFKETGLAQVRRYDGPALPAGTKIAGPAILREPTTTVVVYPGSSAVVTQLGNYLLELAPDVAGTEAVAEEAFA